MPATEPRIVALTRADLPAVKAFLREAYGAAFYGADDAYFDWFYLRNPCRWYAPRAARGEIPVNAVLSADGRIGALHAYVPFDARTPWGGTAGVWDIEWINRSGIPGAGRALVGHLLRDVDVYGGFGCNELSENAFRKIGLEVKPEIPRVVWLLDPRGLAEACATSGVTMPELFPRSGLGMGSRAACTKVDLLAPASVALAREPAAGLWGATRSGEWLRWRFLEHPFIRYETVGPLPDGSGGLAILRIERVVGTPFAVCRILELFADARILGPLLRSVLAFAGEQGCLLADYFTTAIPLAARVVAVSGEAGLTPLSNPGLPFMFQPLAAAPRNSINFVAAAGGKATQAVDFGGFYATKADANQDILRSSFNAPVLAPPSTSRVAAGSSQPCP